MSGLIENHLEKLCRERKELSVLYSQWDIDKKLISKALQSVTTTFAHYSLHDASHSNQIVTQIERVLGEERINKLSATDAWLILESAYLHDIGMVVTNDERMKAWETQEFQDFVKDTASDPENSLCNYAKAILVKKDDPNFFENAKWQFDIWKSMIFIFAEYFRRIHPDRAGKIAIDPTLISLNSPRTELLPSRLFRTVGKICESHGKDFDEVMELEECTSGISTDDGHPRFVAFLLRLGDLLDLDNNRFCPVLLKTIGSVPDTTTAHINKHASITHFRVDTKKIEVIAECEDDETYYVTNQWFSWLEDEIKRQMSRWSDIVPSSEFGLLPNLSKVEIKFNKYLNFNKNIRPKFEIDTSKAIDLFQGSNIYDTEYVFIREALQNAVDSTLISVWYDIKNELILIDDSLKKKIDDKTLEPKDLQDIYKSYPIRVKIEKKDTNSKKVKWSFQLEDKGIGITFDDLKFINKIGSSSKNKNKFKLIESMPDCMKPSGIFGIGLQSYFMVTDKIRFETRSKLNNKSLLIDINDPKSKGNILIEEKKESLKFGNKLSFEMEFDNIPSSISYSLFDDSDVGKAISNFDPVKDFTMDYSIGYILKELNKYNKICPFPIELKINNEVYNFNKKEQNTGLYDIKQHIEMFLDFDFYYNKELSIFYRNVWVKKSRLKGFLLCWSQANFFKGKSSEYLTLNRDDILNDKHLEVRNVILESIKNVLPEYYKRLKDNKVLFAGEILTEVQIIQKIQALSLFIEIYFKGDFNINEDLKDILNKWEDINLKIFSDSTEDLKLKDLFDKEKIQDIDLTYNSTAVSDKPNVFIKYSIDLTNKKLTLDMQDNFNGITPAFFNLIDTKLYLNAMQLSTNYNLTHRNYFNNNNRFFRYIFNYNTNYKIPDQSIIKLISEQLIFSIRDKDAFSRIIIPCFEGFDDLEIEYIESKLFYSRSILPEFKKQMLSPYYIENSKLTLRNFDDLIVWVKNNTDKNISKEEIRKLYVELIKKFDELMKDEQEWKKAFNKDVIDPI